MRASQKVLSTQSLRRHPGMRLHPFPLDILTNLRTTRNESKPAFRQHLHSLHLLRTALPRPRRLRATLLPTP